MPDSLPSPAHALSGHRTLVVGASSGIGRAIGIGAARSGARVAFAGRRRELLDDAVAEAGGDALAVRCDVTIESEVDAAVAATAEAFGGLDSVIYSTAIDPLVRIADVDAATWTHLLATNVVGASLVTRAALAVPARGARPGALHLGDVRRAPAAGHGGVRLQQGGP